MNLPEKQFLLTSSEQTFTGDYAYCRIGSFRLYHCPSLPVRDIAFTDRPNIHGVILGWTPATMLMPEEQTLEISWEELGELGGRWIYIDNDEIRLDPMGSFSLVYQPDSRMAASTTAAMPREDLAENTRLVQALGLPEQDAWYPFGTTPYSGVRRLLPNHHLSLDTFKAKRCDGWPVARSGNNSESVAILANNLKKIMGNLVAACMLLIALTAGNESRMLLAAAEMCKEKERERISYYTIGNSSRSFDAATAGKLARKFGLDWSLYLQNRHPESEIRWFERTGRSVGGNAMQYAGVKESLPADRLRLQGMGGEIGRAFYYREYDRSDQPPPVPELLRRMKLPADPELVRAGEQWVASLPALDTWGLLDMLYLENRLGAWAAPQIFGDVSPITTIWPLNQASSVVAMRTHPLDFKRDQQQAPKVVEQLRPELLSIPINERIGLSRVRAKMGRVVAYARSFLPWI